MNVSDVLHDSFLVFPEIPTTKEAAVCFPSSQYCYSYDDDDDDEKDGERDGKNRLDDDVDGTRGESGMDQTPRSQLKSEEPGNKLDLPPSRGDRGTSRSSRASSRRNEKKEEEEAGEGEEGTPKQLR